MSTQPDSNEPRADTAPAPRPRRWVRTCLGLSLGAAALPLLLLGVVLIVYLLTPHVAHGVYICTTCTGTPTLYSVSMVSSSEGWAVGETTGPAAPRGVIAHYVNGQWMQASLPTNTPPLFSVAMLSASNGWSVGDRGTILHYTGGAWVRVASPIVSRLQSLSMLSPTDGWAVSLSGDFLHYTGDAWTAVVTTSRIFGLQSLVMVSPDEGWAVGAHMIAHYHNGAWTALGPADLPASISNLYSLAMVSTDEGWAVGGDANGAAILHYQRGQWQQTPLPVALPQTILRAIAMVSASEGWAMGYDIDHNQTVILHYTQGTWTPVPNTLHFSVQGIAMLSASNGWAVGNLNTTLEYADGKWC
jgi:photosystem II stability/assembly factor-like uncharacterized protein